MLRSTPPRIMGKSTGLSKVSVDSSPSKRTVAATSKPSTGSKSSQKRRVLKSGSKSPKKSSAKKKKPAAKEKSKDRSDSAGSRSTVKIGNTNRSGSRQALEESIVKNNSPLRQASVERSEMKEVGIDADPELLYQSIRQLYNPETERDPEYQYLLQFEPNSGRGTARSRDRYAPPTYREIDFYDKLPARGKDTSPPKGSLQKIALDQNKAFEAKYSEMLQFGELMDEISLKNINYSFSPTVMKSEEFYKMLKEIFEERAKLEVKTKLKTEGKGLHTSNYFSFSSFCIGYFKKLFPVAMKREKFIFNFLWTLTHIKNNEFVSFVKDLFTKTLGFKDLMHLLMVLDFVKLNMRRHAGMTYVNLLEVGPMFQHADTLVDLIRLIVLNYDEQFKACYEQRFLMLKGDDEYMTVYDFIGTAARAFNILEREGIVPTLRKVSLHPVPLGKKGYPEGSVVDNHLLRCMGYLDQQHELLQMGQRPGIRPTGMLQDRSISKSKKGALKDQINWQLWADYPAKDKSIINKGKKEATTKQIEDFFSVELDEKVQKIAQEIKKKQGKKVYSPVPYQNLTTRTQDIVDNLDVDMRRSADGHYSPQRRDPTKNQLFFTDNTELDVFSAFEKLGKKPSFVRIQAAQQPPPISSRDHPSQQRRSIDKPPPPIPAATTGSRRTSEVQPALSTQPRLSRDLTQEHPRRQTIQYEAPSNYQAIQDYEHHYFPALAQRPQPPPQAVLRNTDEEQMAKKMESVHQFLTEDLRSSCNEILDRQLERVSSRFANLEDHNQLREVLADLLQVKIDSLLHAIFEDDVLSWCSVLQIDPDTMSHSERTVFDNLLRRLNELRRARIENINRGLIQQITNTVLDEPKLRLMIKQLVESSLK